MDFKSWAQSKKAGVPRKIPTANSRLIGRRPLINNELGTNTWNFLHTIVAYYPSVASEEVQLNMNQFFTHFTQFYPCKDCAEEFTKILAERPPETASQAKLSQWLCWAHNQVNKKLGKPEFDCTKINQRWLTGWVDGSC